MDIQLIAALLIDDSAHNAARVKAKSDNRMIHSLCSSYYSYLPAEGGWAELSLRCCGEATFRVIQLTPSHVCNPRTYNIHIIKLRPALTILLHAVALGTIV